MAYPTGQAPSAENELATLCSTLHVDETAVRRFIADYLQLLDQRISRIDRDLERRSVGSAAIGLLSLAASSSMLGADAVAEAAEELRRHALARDPFAADHDAGDRQALIHSRQALQSAIDREHRRLTRIRAVTGDAQGASR